MENGNSLSIFHNLYVNAKCVKDLKNCNYETTRRKPQGSSSRQ